MVPLRNRYQKSIQVWYSRTQLRGPLEARGRQALGSRTLNPKPLKKETKAGLGFQDGLQSLRRSHLAEELGYAGFCIGLRDLGV